MDHTLIALCALLLNAVLGGPRAWYEKAGLARAAAVPARAIRHLEKKLNRESRSVPDREWRGWVMVSAAMLLSLLVGAIVGWILRENLKFIELVLVASMLPVRPVWERAAAIRRGLTQPDIPAARQALAGTPWKHHALLDEHGLARAAIETLIVEFSEKILAPVLAYAWLGLPALFLVKSITLLRDALIHAPDFGKGARVAHSALHTIPARITGGLWLATPMLLPDGDSGKASVRIIDSFLNDGPRAHNVRVAGAVLQRSFGGPTSPYLSQWTEGGTAKAIPADIRRAQACYLLATVFLFMLVGVFF